ncbi:V-type ATP synthase subunit I [Desulfohalovibrio reitneri]|uniref:V-type ATP synthase subunit I n=1 Tax=Desulfohalovibrio reitneri TaxID=1307759 RepID=UPI0004A6F27D|nr:hypothetical protein [Desulfohalovibrio reitneri]
MIVPMRKLLLLCRRDDRDEVMVGLRRLGAVHLEPSREPHGDGLEGASSWLAHVEGALRAMPLSSSARPSGQDARTVVERVWTLVNRREHLLEERAGLAAERRRAERLGDFDPGLARELESKGVVVRFFHGPPKKLPPKPDEGLILRLLTQDSDGTDYALVGRREPGEHETPDAVSVPMPELSLSAIDRLMADTDEELARIDTHLREHAGDRPVVAALRDEAASHLHYLRMRESMDRFDEAGGLAAISGWIPVEREGELRAAAAEHGFGLELSDPPADEEPPTLIRNPRWVRPIQAVMDMIGVVPGYREIDFSAAFLLFLSLFFAMLVGDAGYGTLFLGLTFLGRKLAGHKVPSRVFSLLTVMSCATIVWGALTGTYFGLTALPGPLRSLRVDWLTGPGSDHNVMLLCFIIGAVHLTLAHLWNLVRFFPDLRFLAQLGWIATTWAMFFAARAMVLLEPFPQAMLWVLAAGVALIVVFMTPPSRLKSEWFNHVMFPLNLIGNFVDVVSYVRLFAVGAATLAVAAAFNNMAVGDGVSGPLGALLAALILFLGHSLNILLAMMGVLVHGVRLNTLEFANHLGLQWKGRKFDPFREHNKTTD